MPRGEPYSVSSVRISKADREILQKQAEEENVRLSEILRRALATTADNYRRQGEVDRESHEAQGLSRWQPQPKSWVERIGPDKIVIGILCLFLAAIAVPGYLLYRIVAG